MGWDEGEEGEKGRRDRMERRERREEEGGGMWRKEEGGIDSLWNLLVDPLSEEGGGGVRRGRRRGGGGGWEVVENVNFTRQC